MLRPHRRAQDIILKGQGKIPILEIRTLKRECCNSPNDNSTMAMDAATTAVDFSLIFVFENGGRLTQLS
jgi:hypothetical protein